MGLETFGGRQLDEIAQEGEKEKYLGQPMVVPRVPVMLQRQIIDYGDGQTYQENNHVSDKPNTHVAISEVMLEVINYPLLSDSEKKVLLSLTQGLINKQVARALKMPEATVKNQIARIYRKLGVATRIELIRKHQAWNSLSAQEREFLIKQAREKSEGEKTGLSKREAEVMQLLLSGLTNQQIATELTLSPNTVKNHVSNVIRKMGVASRIELVLNHPKQVQQS